MATLSKSSPIRREIKKCQCIFPWKWTYFQLELVLLVFPQNYIYIILVKKKKKKRKKKRIAALLLLKFLRIVERDRQHWNNDLCQWLTANNSLLELFCLGNEKRRNFQFERIDILSFARFVETMEYPMRMNVWCIKRTVRRKRRQEKNTEAYVVSVLCVYR